MSATTHLIVAVPVANSKSRNLPFAKASSRQARETESGTSLPFDPNNVIGGFAWKRSPCSSRQFTANAHLVGSDRTGFGRKMAIATVPNGPSSGKNMDD